MSDIIQSGIGENSWINRFLLTAHVQKRMQTRRISLDAIAAAIDFGRVSYHGTAMLFTIGHNEVKRHCKEEPNMSQYQGVQVVCEGKYIVTVYRKYAFLAKKAKRPSASAKWQLDERFSPKSRRWNHE